MKAEGGAERHQGPGQLGPAAACRPIRTSPPPSAAPAAAAAPCAPSRGHNKLRRRPSESHRQHRAAAPRLREHSPVPLRALPGRAQSGRYLNLSSEPARGSLLPPPPLQHGAQQRLIAGLFVHITRNDRSPSARRPVSCNRNLVWAVDWDRMRRSPDPCMCISVTA